MPDAKGYSELRRVKEMLSQALDTVSTVLEGAPEEDEEGNVVDIPEGLSSSEPMEESDESESYPAAKDPKAAKKAVIIARLKKKMG